MAAPPPSRRDVLALAPAAGALWLVGCEAEPPESAGPPLGGGNAPDDTALLPSAPLDARPAQGLDTDPTDGLDTDAPPPDTGPAAELPPSSAGLSLPPWVSLAGPTSARLRFETLDDVPLDVALTRDGATTLQQPTRTPATLTFAIPTPTAGRPPDLAGVHVLHELRVDDLRPGEEVTWRVERGGRTWAGTFRAPPAATGAARLGWLSDTTWPATEATVAALAAWLPDLVAHGGDLHYVSNPADTWSGLFDALQPLTVMAPLQVALGNHENERLGEREQMFDRLFAGQGDPGGGARYHAFSLGAARVLVLDGETFGFDDPQQPQWAWLDAELAAADADPGVRAVIVAWHRPLYTLSRHFQRSAAEEIALLGHLAGHKVTLALHGHAHCFEHFLLGGVHWVVDGSGGAVLYDPNGALAAAALLRPDVVAARVFAEQAHGATLVDIAPDGTLTVQRIAASTGQVTYTFTVPPSAPPA
jgi:hypothetical protein